MLTCLSLTHPKVKALDTSATCSTASVAVYKPAVLLTVFAAAVQGKERKVYAVRHYNGSLCTQTQPAGAAINARNDH